MKSLTRRISVFALIAAMMLAIVAGSGLVLGGVANAVTEDHSNGYFYNQISTDSRAEKFYKAFETLETNGSFKSGKVEYDLVQNGVTDVNDVANYVNNGDGTIPKAYGAGRDAYFMDHPDLFYIDVYGTSISAGQQGSDYVAFLDTSRVTTLYHDSANSTDKVNTAIAAYEAKIAEAVNGANAIESVVDKIKYVNNFICDTTEYSFCSMVVDGQTVYEEGAAYIYTSYGALVNGKAVCEGYAMAFKAIMDRLDIPCVGIKGYASSDGENFQPHMWNYVQIDGMWYAIDVTWNATSGNREKWMLMGSKQFSESHVEDNVVSTSGFELKYPALKPYEYGNDYDENGMEIVGEYKDSASNTGKELKLTIVYDGKGAGKLQEEGKYLAARIGDKKENGEIVWYQWVNCVVGSDVLSSGMTYDDEKTEFFLSANTEYMQFALLNCAPDKGLFDEPPYFMYDETKFTEESFICDISAPYKNDGYGTYFPAPGAVTFNPANTGDLRANTSYDITVSYNVPLELVEGKTVDDVTIDFYSTLRNDSVHNYATVTDVVWDGGNTISFKFTPSKQFEHNGATYYFYPTNLVGGQGKKVPDPFGYTFKGKSVVCSKVFNDGRLYMSVFGQPSLLDTTDLSMSNFQDEKGNYYAENQRSQLILVANKPSTERETEMNDVLKEETGIKDDDVVTSASYEIDLQICGVVQNVPNGSYMQVSMGFPEGFSPDDEGTTFKIYHYKHDNDGNITGVEEIPVIVTQYGLIAQVKSFSPFMIVQLKNTSDAVTKSDSKSVYATVVGNGGTVTTANADGKSGIVSVTDDTVVFDVKADTDYQLAKVFLNGVALDNSRVENGKLTLTKSELEGNNMLEVTFVTKEAAESYEERGIEISYVMATVDASTPDVPFTPETSETPSNSNAGLIAGCVVAAVVVIACVAVLVIVLMKKKDKKSKA